MDVRNIKIKNTAYYLIFIIKLKYTRTETCTSNIFNSNYYYY